ncbi:MAG: IS66 family transposase [Acidobacteria bacterium]|nr:IS66 family transposase [Acidobacteriota bacterium]
MKGSGRGRPPERTEQPAVIEFVPKQELDRAQQQIERQQREIERLKEEIERLCKELEAAWRAAKRQAAPFSRGEPKTDPKPPGRKSGERYGEHRRRAVPAPVDERHLAPLPERCPCGGRIGWEQSKPQYQEEIVRRKIVRRFEVEIGRCLDCGKRWQGRHPLQTSDGLDAAQVQVGPEALTLAAQLNKQLGLSYGHTAAVLRLGYGLSLSRGGLCRALGRLAGKAEPTYQALTLALQQSLVIWMDETGWKVAARLQWLWVAASREVTLYKILPGRGWEQAVELLRPAYAGCLEHDGWAVYWRFGYALHQSCLNHLLERCRKVILISSLAAARFPQAVKGLLEKGLELRDRHQEGRISEHGLWTAAGRLQAQLGRLLERSWRTEANRRLGKHLRRQEPHLFTFLHCPGVEATNNRAERALRPAVIARKVWGGNRTRSGAQTQQILASVLATCRQQGKDAFPRLVGLLRAPRAMILDLAPSRPPPAP